PGERTLFFAHSDGRGVRNGRWKASKLPRRGWELFDIEQDPGETTDISAQHPDQLNRLVRRMSKWRHTSTVRPIAPGENAAAAPAIPLVACDPYFSIWSTTTELADSDTTHWTGKPHRLTSMVSVDGKAYRLMGSEPQAVDALSQTGVEISATQSKYDFEGAGVSLELTFTTPALPYDIDQLSRPVTYASYRCQSTDGESHQVRLYFEAHAEIAVDTRSQQIQGTATEHDGLIDLSLGSVEQSVLGRSGDDVRIDWGYLHLASPAAETCSAMQGRPRELRRQFVANGEFAGTMQALPAQPAARSAAAVVLDAGAVGDAPVERWLMLAYDDLYSIEFMQKPLRPYWRRNGMNAEQLLAEAADDREALIKQCDQFDRELAADLREAGGQEYADLATLAYRQCFAAGKFVADANGQPIQFCKENHSNGCIGTSDVFYPMAPQFLLFGPSLAKSFVAPFLEYAASDRWKFPFAPHDLGTYPKANGQVYGGGERSAKNQMPVEESGNMLILMAAIAKIEGNADFAGQYWPQLKQWAEYLKQEGFDPDNQLCTDDFAGHMAHNVNLSAKAICGLGAFAQLCEMRGEGQLAAEYRALAEEFAGRWMAAADDGDHYRLAFDKANTWSQKYNLVWDRVLGLNLFPDSVFRKEMAYYRRIQNRFGLPLDNRRGYTKLDWVLWTATLTQDRDDFEALVAPVYRFLRATPNRVPMTDWYETETAARVGFTARPVVGGVFMQLLHDEALWKKWAERDQTHAGDYAPMPKPPKVTIRLPAADTEPASWRYTTTRPSGKWSAADYDDSSWQRGLSGFGTTNTPGARVKTVWNTPEIWLRRDFDLDTAVDANLRLHVHHDEDAEIYINGVLAKRIGGFSSDYQQLSISAEAVAALKPNGNVMAVHCRQTSGGQFIDVGLATVEPAE
ncbi:MAG: DUF4965 domain-containing protein, partial [Planctomycetales bacterium]|nr:DUF4965 domain-containing protein [Planctomycetales bacterium]